MSADDQTAVPAPERSYFQEIAGTLEAPWEIGKAQPAIAGLASDGVFDGKSVLDVGCCIGDNSIHIAKHAKGATVTGCDLVERALGVARSKAAEAGVEVEFVQQDLLLPLQGALQGRQFDVVLDSAVYHVFARGSKDRQDYVHTLGQLVKPGGRIVMLVFSDKQPGDQGPVRITKEDIHGSYPPPGWTVERIDDAIYECVPPRFEGKAQAYLAFIRKND
ncbi:hypothetical protein ABPG77_011099 [Micractinium sp. CCAP 211/92]